MNTIATILFNKMANVSYRVLHRILTDKPGMVGSRNKEVREGWLKKTLSAIPSGSHILDAGAGELQYKKFCNHLEYVSQDFGKYEGKGDGCGYQMGAWDQSKIDIFSDITKIPEPDSSFDAIMCIEVFEHIPDPIAAIREFSRLLKVGGVLILTAPFCSLTHFSPYHFYTGYNRYFYEKWLPEFGFEIKEINYNGNFFEYLAQEMRRVDEMAKKYCNGAMLSRKERLGKEIVLGILNRLSASDQGSKEFLSFGLHTRAVKMTVPSL